MNYYKQKHSHKCHQSQEINCYHQTKKIDKPPAKHYPPFPTQRKHSPDL